MDRWPSQKAIRVLKILVGLTFFAIIAFSGSSIFLQKSNYSQKNADLQASIQFIGWLHENWTKGDFRRLLENKKLSCSLFWDSDKLGREFSRCNPEYLDCLLDYEQKQSGGLTVNERKVLIEKNNLNHFYRPIKKVNFGSSTLNAVYEIYFKIGEEEFYTYLEDSCRDSFLPEDRYAIGIYQKDKDDWFWNNRGRFLFVDKTPVLKYKYKLWMNENVEFKREDFYTYVENIPSEKAHAYCALHAGKIVQSHVLDASSFFPTERTPESVNYFRPPFAWTKSTELKIDEKDKCRYIFSKECLGKNYSAAFAGIPSWIGLSNIHGGLVEEIYNPFSPQMNLVPSSFYFDFSSPMQHVGNRMDFENMKKLEENFQTTFRCMKEVAND